MRTRQFKSIYERLDAAGKKRQDLLLRRDQLDDRGGEPAAEPAAVLRHSTTSSSLTAKRAAAGLLLHRAELQRPHRRRAAPTCIASDQHPDHHVREGERFIASVYKAIRRTRRSGRRRPCWWSTTSTAASTITCRLPPARLTGSSRSRDATETGEAVPVRSSGRPRAGRADLAVDSQGHASVGRRARLRARVDPGDGHRLAARRASTTGRPARRRPRRSSTS